MILGEPFMEDKPFDFGRQETTRHIRQLIPIMMEDRLIPPPEESYSLHRKMAGAFLLCTRLGAVINCYPMFQYVYQRYTSWLWAECFVCHLHWLSPDIYTGCHLSNAINTSRTMQTSINTSWIQTQFLINTSNTHIGWEYKTQCHRYANKILWWCMMGETATTCFLQGSLSKAIEFTNSLSTLEREWGMYIHIGVKRRAIAPATLKWGYQVPRDIRLRGSPLPRVFDGPPESQGALLLSCQSLSYVHCSDQNCRRQITGSFQRPVRGGEEIVSWCLNMKRLISYFDRTLK